jgi:Ca2+-dependent lipid-binding protein
MIDLDKQLEIRKGEELRSHKLENDSTENELSLKKRICCWVQWVVSIYLIFVASVLSFVVAATGALSNSVLIALLTTTTINILGLPLMIIISLFPSKKRFTMQREKGIE